MSPLGPLRHRYPAYGWALGGSNASLDQLVKALHKEYPARVYLPAGVVGGKAWLSDRAAPVQGC